MTNDEITIDCDALPYIPARWKIKKHLKGGVIKFNSSKVRFYQSDCQRDGGSILLKDLIAQTEGMRRGNACILDHLLKKTHLLEDSWKFNEDDSTRYILFVDTQYLGEDDNLYVRCLYWSFGMWDWSLWPCSEVDARFVVFLLGEEEVL